MNSLLSLNPLSSRLSIRRPFGRKNPHHLNPTGSRPGPSTSNNLSIPASEQTNVDAPGLVMPEVAMNASNRFNFSRILPGREREVIPTTPENRLEKLLKKAKPFFDERAKPRLRLLALWNLLDVADDLDQAMFFQEHSDKIYSAVYCSFIAQTEKIRKRSERPNSFNSKDMVTLVKILMLLRKIFLLLPDKIRQGWHQSEIANILTQILSSGNHYKLREIGLRLLLIWINVQSIETPESRELYRNAIPLGIFFQELGRSDLILHQETIGDLSCIPIYPTTHFLQISEVGELIQLILDNITYLAHVAAGSIPPCDKIRILETDGIESGVAVGVGIDAAYASAKFMFELFKKYYLVKLFPQCARRLGLINVPRDQAFGFPSCPPSALHKLVSFLVEHCIDELKGNPKITASPACPILKTIILGSPENREFIHDIIANALSLPIHDIQNLESARGAAYILAVWMLSGDKERPSFLRRNSRTSGNLLDAPSASTIGSFSQANSYLRQYFSMLISVLETGFESCNNNSRQEILIREVLSIFRAVSQNGTIQLEEETWESLLMLLVNSFIVFATKAREVPNCYLPDDLVDYFIETLFFVWARSMTRNERLWSKLNAEILKTPRWVQTVTQWRSIMNQLVRILGEVYYESKCEDGKQSRKARPQRPASVGVAVRKSSRPTSSITESIARDETIHTTHSHLSAASSDPKQGKPDGDTEVKQSFSYVRLLNSDLNTTNYDKNSANENSSVFFKAPVVLKDQDLDNFSLINKRLTMEFANIEDSGFARLFSLNWNKDVIVSMWKNFLHLLGNPNQITDPAAHTNAIRCLVEMWDILAQIRSEQSFMASCKPDLFEFAPWIFQASEISSAFREGHLLAFGCVCRMLCRLQEDRIDEVYYANFYRILLRGLSIKDNELHHILFVNCRKLFALFLPGCPTVIPAFLSTIKTTLNSNARYMAHYVNEPMCQNAATILLSVLCFPNQFPSLRIPHVFVRNAPSVESKMPEYTDAGELKNELEQAIFSCILETKKLYRLSDKTAQTHSMLIRGVCVLAFDELLSNSNPSVSLIQTCVQSILEHLYCHVSSVVISVIESLYTFSEYTERLRMIDHGLVYDIIGNVIRAIDEYMETVNNDTISETGFLVARLFYCLLEWIMYSPSEFMSHSGLRQMIFVTLEKATQLVLPEKSDFDLQTHKFKGYRNFSEIVYSYTPSSTLPKVASERNELHSTKIESNIIQESAEIVLAHLLNYFSNQTQGSSPVQGSNPFHEVAETSEIPQLNGDNVTHFIYNNNTLLTLLKTPNNDGEIKIFARNMTGKYSWDPRVFYEAPLPDLMQGDVDHPVFQPRKMSNSSSKNDSERPDKAFENASNPMPKEPKDYPLPPSPEELDDPETEATVIESPTSSLDPSLPSEWLESTIHDMPAATIRPERASTLQRQKTLLLSQLGMLNQNITGEETFIHLNPTSSLDRDIRGLDKKPGRETVKIGVLYVGPGQEDESSILSNSKGSLAYEQFLHELGQEVELKTHQGYLGGLERNSTTGKTAIYHSSISVEMMFHDVTRIPTNPNDPKQLKKKRHIGNDHVHIVWNEHCREYRRSTIGGDFGNVQIIITPSPSGLYGIDVYRDSEIPLFGPVLDGMVLPDTLLAPLVRMTALNASRYAIYHPFILYRHPYTHRANDIKTICRRHGSQKWTYNQFLSKLFPLFNS